MTTRDSDLFDLPWLTYDFFFMFCFFEQSFVWVCLHVFLTIFYVCVWERESLILKWTAIKCSCTACTHAAWMATHVHQHHGRPVKRACHLHAQGESERERGCFCFKCLVVQQEVQRVGTYQVANLVHTLHCPPTWPKCGHTTQLFPSTVASSCLSTCIHLELWTDCNLQYLFTWSSGRLDHIHEFHFDRSAECIGSINFASLSRGRRQIRVSSVANELIFQTSGDWCQGQIDNFFMILFPIVIM